MPEYPLLIFPEPAHAESTRRRGGGSKPKLPELQAQAERLAPQFQRLQQVMDQQRLTLQDNPLGLQPEQALVLETIGPIDNFINAVSKVQGLEWLGEFELDDVAPAYGFEDDQDPQKVLKGQLFLVMTDQQALHELQNLFSIWRQNQAIPFPRGLAPWKHAFDHLYAIRPWDAQDRIRETGILEDWQCRLEDLQETVPFEAELWFRNNEHRRQQAEASLRNIVEALGGEIIQQAVVPQIAYHGILGKIPANHVSQILAQQDIQLLQCEEIMHLRPLGQCAVRITEDLTQLAAARNGERTPLPHGEPIVALFDGLPLTRHQLLDGRLIVDDPDGFEDAYQAQERVHGTAMASLICHGDFDQGGEASARPIYVRPIMQPRRGFDGQSFEAIPEGILPVDLLHRAVRRLYETDANGSPAAPGVRVINLSVCDRSRPLDRAMSAWARLLDWLSWEYNVLFVVSAGNHSHDITLGVQRTDLPNLSPENRQKAVVEAIAADTRHRRLLSPAETLNGLAVGAMHSDASSLPATNSSLIDPYTRTDLPSTICAHGPGYRRTVKPDIFLPGGRQFLREKLGNTHSNAILQTSASTRPPGQCVASPGAPGELNRVLHTRGTSNAAALASRWAMSLFDVIEQLRAQPGTDLPAEYDAVLLKTLLVHGADWTGAGELYESILKNAQNSRGFKDYVARFLGYGSTNVAKVLTCTDQRVTVLGFGQLTHDEGQDYRFPLPPSLSAVTESRRLIITLAWLTPVNSTRHGYRIARLWFDPKYNIAPHRLCADHRAVQRGTVQHEVLMGDQAIDFQDGDAIAIKINCRADAGEINTPVRYGLAVTLEVAEGVDIPVYQEVRSRLRVRIPIRGGNST